MKHITLTTLRFDQPQLFEVLFKKNGLWSVIPATTEPVILLLGKNKKTLRVRGFNEANLPKAFSWAKKTLNGLKNEYLTLMETANALMYQFIQSQSVFVLYEEGNNETVFNYFDKKKNHGEDAIASCRQIMTPINMMSVIQINASLYTPDINVLAHEISHHADYIPLYIIDKLNFIQARFSDTPLFQNALKYEIESKPRFEYAAQIDLMMRDKIKNKEYDSTHYHAEMFARLNALFIDGPKDFLKHHPVLGRIFNDITLYMIQNELMPDVFDTYKKNIRKIYQNTIWNNNAKKALTHLEQLNKTTHLDQHVKLMNKTLPNTISSLPVLHSQLRKILLDQVKDSLNKVCDQFQKDCFQQKQIYERDHQYILCNRHRLYQQICPLKQAKIPWCLNHDRERS